MTGHEKRQFHGTGSAKPQNITGLALNEMWGLYGYDVSIASIVNDGPGRPDEVSVRSMTQCFKSMFENDPPIYEQWKSCTRNKGTEAAKCSRINREEIAMEMLQDELDESVWRRLKEVYYPHNTPSYHPFALHCWYHAVAQNDSKMVWPTQKLTYEYLAPDIKSGMQEVAECLS